MVKTVFFKAGSDMVMSFAKAFGSEAGKKPFAKKEKEKVTMSLNEARKFVDCVFEEHDWEIFHENVSNASEYITRLAKVAGITGVAYLTLPVIAGAATYGTLGASVSGLVYTATNIVVITGGVCGGVYVKNKKGAMLYNNRKDITNDQIYE